VADLKKSNDVFISYRRDVGGILAMALWQNLDLHGIDAFYDIESIRAGDFGKIILRQIEARPYFILLLTPGTLERCSEPSDWLRQEIEHAVATQRVIVPVFTPAFEFSDCELYLPNELGAAIRSYNAQELPQRWFKAAVDRLAEEILLPIHLYEAEQPTTRSAAGPRYLFLSYVHEERSLIEVMADKLRRTGHRVYFDEELKGGQDWWLELMTHIQQCDVFAPVLSRRYVDSVPCRLEASYAEDLDKPFFPIRIADFDTNRLSFRIATAQWCSLHQDDENSFLDLVGELAVLSDCPPLPNPLPDMPEVPVSFLTKLWAQVSSPSDLTKEDQALIILEVKSRLTTEDSTSAIDLLRRLRERPDVFLVIANEIDSLLHGLDNELKLRG
jgi:hypothetical protein